MKMKRFSKILADILGAIAFLLFIASMAFFLLKCSPTSQVRKYNRSHPAQFR